MLVIHLRERLAVLLPANLEKLDFADAFGAEVWHVGVIGEAVDAHVVEGCLVKEEAFLAAGDGDAALKDEVEGIGVDTAGEQNRIDHCVKAVVVKNIFGLFD